MGFFSALTCSVPVLEVAKKSVWAMYVFTYHVDFLQRSVCSQSILLLLYVSFSLIIVSYYEPNPDF